MITNNEEINDDELMMVADSEDAVNYPQQWLIIIIDHSGILMVSNDGLLLIVIESLIISLA